MKTMIISIFLLVSVKCLSQSSDILYIPNQNSLLLTYQSKNPLGFYLGGYFRTSFPQPYIYTTPLTIVNRLGINYNIDNKFSIMGGAFVENYTDSLSLQPDIWLKVNPLRVILKNENGFDFSIGINYMKEIRYAVGLSIPF